MIKKEKEVVYVCYTHWEEGTTIHKVFRQKKQAEEWVEETKPRLRKMGDLFYEGLHGISSKDYRGKLTDEEKERSLREAEAIEEEYGYGEQDCWASFDEVEIE